MPRPGIGKMRWSSSTPGALSSSYSRSMIDPACPQCRVHAGALRSLWAASAARGTRAVATMAKKSVGDLTAADLDRDPRPRPPNPDPEPAKAATQTPNNSNQQSNTI